MTTQSAALREPQARTNRVPPPDGLIALDQRQQKSKSHA
jgi:hypothetical protein